MQKKGTLSGFYKSGVISEDAIDVLDVEYLAQISIGRQRFIVSLDTGSSDFWIPDISCSVCSKQHRFNASRSLHYVENGQKWAIQYGLGNAQGFLGNDTLYIFGENSTRLDIPKTIFGQATFIDPHFQEAGFDGMLGLAFPSLSQFQALPPIYNAFQQGLLDEPIFTVYLQKRGNLNDVPGGVFTYGGLDTEHCSTEIDYHPLSRSTYYQFTIDSVSFSGGTTGVGISGPWETISDTGTSFMYGPTKIVTQFAKMVGATLNE
uniref:Peptidase A1 domain-containing protein n=1 Tax=Panagrolaimus davidi TaxID=227884 RepID=A0A914Q3T4_9BILA